MPPVTLKTAKHIHFTGIKGVGMTSVALCTQDLGATITGSDTAEEFVTAEILNQRHLAISSGFSPKNIPHDTDLLVYTGAHHGAHNVQVKFAQKKQIPVLSHAAAVGQLMEGKLGISVCGVGGKTTTSSMIAFVLDRLNQHPSYAIGVGYINNLGAPGKYSLNSRHFVAEADEYVVSPGSDNTPRFVLQDPKIIVCTNISHDHPDVYPTLSSIKGAYLKFFAKLSSTGTLIINLDNQPLAKIAASWHQSKLITFGSQKSANWQIQSIKVVNQTTIAQVKTPQKNIIIKLVVPGRFNLENAVAAAIATTQLGLPLDSVIATLNQYTGTRRRFEKIGIKNNIYYYDDYAHHPTEISATINAASLRFPHHTFSRTKALFDQFANSLALADQVWLTDIYASARETADNSVSSQKLASRIKQSTYVGSLTDLVKYARQHLQPNDVLITLGAGDIYKIHRPLIYE
jgi:UDP-N-acetylmuramate--alanine ligase